MLNFEEISKMSYEEWTNYVKQLDAQTITISRDMLNFINGFMLCKELNQLKLTNEQLCSAFYSSLLGNTIAHLENNFKDK